MQGFIVDFYCHQAQTGLVVEVDGDVHDLHKEEDERREKVLSALGLKIVRFRNDEVMRGLSAVVGKIREFIIHPCSSGDVHDLQKEEDERREKVLSALGLRIFAVAGRIRSY